jgi:hypothetical protein
MVLSSKDGSHEVAKDDERPPREAVGVRREGAVDGDRRQAVHHWSRELRTIEV